MQLSTSFHCVNTSVNFERYPQTYLNKNLWQCANHILGSMICCPDKGVTVYLCSGMCLFNFRSKGLICPLPHKQEDIASRRPDVYRRLRGVSLSVMLAFVISACVQARYSFNVYISQSDSAN